MKSTLSITTISAYVQNIKFFVWFALVYTVQLLTYPVWRFLLIVIFKGKVVLPEQKLKPSKKPYVIYSNHKSFLDSGLIIAGLGFVNAMRVLPVFTLTADLHYYNPIKRLPAFLLGSYPTNTKRRGAKGFDRSIDLLARRVSIVIFPEGRRNLTTGSAKSGLERINNKAKTYLLPVGLHWERKGFLNRSITIHYNSAEKRSGTSQELLRHAMKNMERS